MQGSQRESLQGDARRARIRSVETQPSERREVPSARSRQLRLERCPETSFYRKQPRAGEETPFGSLHRIVPAIHLRSNCLFNDRPLFALTISPGKLFHTFMILCVEKKRKKEKKKHFLTSVLNLFFFNFHLYPLVLSSVLGSK